MKPGGGGIQSELDLSKVVWRTTPEKFHIKINSSHSNIEAGPLDVILKLSSGNLSLNSPNEAILRGIKSENSEGMTSFLFSF